MEKQLLPDVALKPAYSRVVWLYVFRDFSKSAADRAAGGHRPLRHLRGGGAARLRRLAPTRAVLSA
ncbi:MAG: hypothetical protein ABGZ17_23230, partial [Planctomycetaceae bacterium]